MPAGTMKMAPTAVPPLLAACAKLIESRVNLMAHRIPAWDSALGNCDSVLDQGSCDQAYTTSAFPPVEAELIICIWRTHGSGTCAPEHIFCQAHEEQEASFVSLPLTSILTRAALAMLALAVVAAAASAWYTHRYAAEPEEFLDEDQDESSDGAGEEDDEDDEELPEGSVCSEPCSSHSRCSTASAGRLGQSHDIKMERSRTKDQAGNDEGEAELEFRSRPLRASTRDARISQMKTSRGPIGPRSEPGGFRRNDDLGSCVDNEDSFSSV